jgi:hypothetical protein
MLRTGGAGRTFLDSSSLQGLHGIVPLGAAFTQETMGFGKCDSVLARGGRLCALGTWAGAGAGALSAR